MDGWIQEGILPPWVERAAHPIRPSVVGHLRLLLAVAAAGDRVFTKRKLRPIRPTAKGLSIVNFQGDSNVPLLDD